MKFELSLEQINELLASHFPGHSGIRITKMEEGVAVGEIDLEAHHLHPGGIVHGGVAYTLADTCMAWAILPTLKAGENPSTIEQKITYLAPATEGVLRCEAKILRRGRSVVTRFQGFVRNSLAVEGILKCIPIPVDVVNSQLAKSSSTPDTDG